MLKRILIFILILTEFSFSVYSQKLDPTEIRINELLSKMTLQEKIGQMNQLTGFGLAEKMKADVREGRTGSILNEIDPLIINEFQRIAVEESRLGIPILFARDIIHGFKTIFPVPLGQAATWNPQLAEDAARTAAIEATSCGVRWTFAPMIDVSRDPRWGRIVESCGEDPYLTSVMGTAMIKGFQGDNLNNPTSMAACAKHFVGYGASESGKDYSTTWLPEELLRDVYFPPFEAAVKANVASFMCAFNDINGTPCSGNKHLNVDILRKEWKYDGLLGSDWGSIEQMINHGVCKDVKATAEKAINAGVDMDMMGNSYISSLEELVKTGIVPEALVDESVRNILRLKFRLGLFENPYTRIQENKPFYTEDALRKAKQTAIESVILLKNDKNILPLSTDIKSLAIIGPLSDSPTDQNGTWCFDGEPERTITPLAAIKESFGNKIKIIAEKGLTYSRDKNPEGIAKAVAAAKKSDIILLFLGEEAIITGESRCRADINFPGAQSEMLSALKKTGKPIILIVMAGRPLTIEKEIAQADAVLYAFHGGTMAGPALSDLIFGKAVPSGKLPITFPRMVGQVPIYYAHKNTGRPATDIVLIDDIPVLAGQTSIGCTNYFLDAGDKPLFPFGYGLSYSTFEYSDVKLSNSQLSKGEMLTVECNIKNTGKYEASEILQLYVKDVVGTLARPVRELKGFQKISLKPNETKTVTFTLNSEQLAYWNADMIKRTEPGEFQVWISSDSQSGKPASFEYK